MPKNKYPKPAYSTQGQSTSTKTTMKANPAGGGAAGQPMGKKISAKPRFGTQGQKQAGGK
jgi:hypothetical protein